MTEAEIRDRKNFIKDEFNRLKEQGFEFQYLDLELDKAGFKMTHKNHKKYVPSFIFDLKPNESKLEVWERFFKTVQDYSFLVENEPDPFVALRVILEDAKQRSKHEGKSSNATIGVESSIPSGTQRIWRNIKDGTEGNV